MSQLRRRLDELKQSGILLVFPCEESIILESFCSGSSENTTIELVD